MQVQAGKFRPREEGDLRPRSSQLGLCPLLAANEARGAEPTYPELLVENDLDALHRMESGHSAAQSWYETLQWYCNKQGWIVEFEVPCDDARSIGTIDTLIDTSASALIVVDFKRTDKKSLRERATNLPPSRHNFLQLADYMFKTADANPSRDVLGVLQRDYRSYPPFRSFWMVPDKHWQLIEIIVNNEVVDHVTDIDVTTAIDTADRYMQGAQIPPYKTPIEHWQCASVRKGTGVARCPYFAHCWPVSNPFEIVDGKIWTEEGEYYEV